MKRIAILERFVLRKSYTIGVLRIFDESENVIFTCYTLELSWNNNLRNISSIPLGSYKCEITNSPKFGKCFMVKDVLNRSNILFHKGNYISETKGCILVGHQIDFNNYSKGAFLSSSAYCFNKLMNLNITEFNLKII